MKIRRKLILKMLVMMFVVLFAGLFTMDTAFASAGGWTGTYSLSLNGDKIYVTMTNKVADGEAANLDATISKSTIYHNGKKAVYIEEFLNKSFNSNPRVTGYWTVGEKDYWYSGYDTSTHSQTVQIDKPQFDQAFQKGSVGSAYLYNNSTEKYVNPYANRYTTHQGYFFGCGSGWDHVYANIDTYHDGQAYLTDVSETNTGYYTVYDSTTKTWSSWKTCDPRDAKFYYKDYHSDDKIQFKASCKLGNPSVTNTVEFTFPSYTLTLNANGGSVSTSSYTMKYKKSDNSTINKATHSNSGYEFAGWFTSATGGTQVYDKDGKATKEGTYFTSSGNWNKLQNVTLYAHWTPKQYTLTINPNGGLLYGYGSTSWVSTAQTRKFTYGTAYKFASTSNYVNDSNGHFCINGTDTSPYVPYRSGYVFSRWTYSNGTGTSTLNSGSGYDYTFNSNYAGNVTATAQWNPIISYNAHGGSGTMSSETVTYNGTYTTKANGFTAPSGKMFVGWSTGNDNFVEYAAGDAITNVTAPMTLYAVWSSPVNIAYYRENLGDNESAFSVYNQAIRCSWGNAGYAFLYWKNGSNTYSAGATIPLTTANSTYITNAANTNASIWMNTESSEYHFNIYGKSTDTAYQDRQKWSLISAGSNQYVITNTATGKVIRANSHSTGASANTFKVVLENYDTSLDGIKWVLEPVANSDGFFYLKNVKFSTLGVSGTDYYLTWDPAYGGGLCIAPKGHMYQQWKFSDITTVFNAQWDLYYSVSYDGNLGSVNISDCYSQSGTTATYVLGNTYSIPTASRTWTVTFNSNGGSAVSNQTAPSTFNGWQEQITDSTNHGVIDGLEDYSIGGWNWAAYYNSNADLFPNLSNYVYDTVAAIRHYRSSGKNENRKFDKESYFKLTHSGRTLKFRNLTANVNQAVSLKAVYTNTAITLPSPTKSGYTLEGWYTTSDFSSGYVGAGGASYTPTANTTLYAKWSPNPYTLTVDLKGGKAYKVSGTSTVQFTGTFAKTFYYEHPEMDASVNGKAYRKCLFSTGSSTDNSYNNLNAWGCISQPTKEGHTFAGWGEPTGGTATTYNGYGQFNCDYAGNVTIPAQWTPNQYTVTIDPNGGSMYGVLDADGNEGWVTEPQSRTFLYGQEYLFASTGYYNKDTNGQFFMSNTIQYGLKVPYREGYTFIGWSATGGEVIENIVNDDYYDYIFDGNYAGNVTLTAEWELNDYTLTIDPNGGELYTKENGLDVYTSEPQDRTFTYKEEYQFASTGTYDSGENGHFRMTYETVDNIQIPYREGYDFAGWYTPGGEVTESLGEGYTGEEYYDYYFDGNYPSDVTIIAKWTPKKYTLTIDPDGGQMFGVLADGTVDWTITPQNRIFTYKQNLQFASTRYYGGKDDPNGQFCMENKEYDGIYEPYREGYRFIEWIPSGGNVRHNLTINEYYEYIFDGNNAGDVTVTAQWDENEYEVRLHPNQPSVASSSVEAILNSDDWEWDETGKYYYATFTYDTKNTLPDVNSVFSLTGWDKKLGWYTTSTGGTRYLSGTKIYNMTSENGAVIDLYVKWTANTYYVDYYGNGSTSGSTARSTHTYDVEAPLRANGFKREYTVTFKHNDGNTDTSEVSKYDFKGWTKDTAVGLGKNAKYTNMQKVKNLTTVNKGIVKMFAVWNSKAITIPYLENDDYNFNGWHTKDYELNEDYSYSTLVGNGISPNDTYTPYSNTTLYAAWSEKDESSEGECEPTTSINTYVQWNNPKSDNSTVDYDASQNIDIDGIAKVTVTVDIENKDDASAVNNIITETFDMSKWDYCKASPYKASVSDGTFTVSNNKITWKLADHFEGTATLVYYLQLNEEYWDVTDKTLYYPSTETVHTYKIGSNINAGYGASNNPLFGTPRTNKTNGNSIIMRQVNWKPEVSQVGIESDTNNIYKNIGADYDNTYFVKYDTHSASNSSDSTFRIFANSQLPRSYDTYQITDNVFDMYVYAGDQEVIDNYIGLSKSESATWTDETNKYVSEGFYKSELLAVSKAHSLRNQVNNNGYIYPNGAVTTYDTMYATNQDGLEMYVYPFVTTTNSKSNKTYNTIRFGDPEYTDELEDKYLGITIDASNPIITADERIKTESDEYGKWTESDGFVDINLVDSNTNPKPSKKTLTFEFEDAVSGVNAPDISGDWINTSYDNVQITLTNIDSGKVVYDSKNDTDNKNDIVVVTYDETDTMNYTGNIDVILNPSNDDLLGHLKLEIKVIDNVGNWESKEYDIYSFCLTGEVSISEKLPNYAQRDKTLFRNGEQGSVNIGADGYVDRVTVDFGKYLDDMHKADLEKRYITNSDSTINGDYPSTDLQSLTYADTLNKTMTYLPKEWQVCRWGYEADELGGVRLSEAYKNVINNTSIDYTVLNSHINEMIKYYRDNTEGDSNYTGTDCVIENNVLIANGITFKLDGVIELGGLVYPEYVIVDGSIPVEIAYVKSETGYIASVNTQTIISSEWVQSGSEILRPFKHYFYMPLYAEVRDNNNPYVVTLTSYKDSDKAFKHEVTVKVTFTNNSGINGESGSILDDLVTQVKDN